MGKLNANGFVTGQKTVTTAGTAEALETGQGTFIKNGFSLRMKALSTNTGDVFIGESKAQAEANNWHLAPDQEIELPVNNTNLVWVDVATNGEGVGFFIARPTN